MTPADYPQFVALYNAVYPNRTTTVEEVADADRRRGTQMAAGRWAAFAEDRMLGFAGYAQWAGETHRTWFQVNVVVDEAFRRQGIGTDLYDHLFEEFIQHEPKVLRADAYDNLPSGLPFATSLGFNDVFREGPSHLDLATFDPEPFVALVQRLESEGVEFLSYAAYRKRNPDFAQPLYAAYCEAWKDVPKEEESEISENDFQAWVVADDSQVDKRSALR